MRAAIAKHTEYLFLLTFALRDFILEEKVPELCYIFYDIPVATPPTRDHQF